MADSTNKTQIVKLHHLRPAPGAKTAKTRVGRGEGSKGKTAGIQQDSKIAIIWKRF